MSNLVYPKSFIEARALFRKINPEAGEVVQIEIKDGPLWPFDPRCSITYHSRPGTLTLDDFGLEDYSHRTDPKSYPATHNLNSTKTPRKDDYLLLSISPKVSPTDAQPITRVRQLAEGIGDVGILAELVRMPSGYGNQTPVRTFLNRLTMPLRAVKGLKALLSPHKEYQEAGGAELDGLFQVGWEADRKLVVSTGRLDENFLLKYLSEIDDGRLPVQVNGIMDIDRKNISVNLYRNTFIVSASDYDAEDAEDEEVFRKTIGSKS